MGTVAGRFTKNDFIIKGEVDERLPRVTNGLKGYFPFDGTLHDRMSEYQTDRIVTTSRDKYGSPIAQYNYTGMKFIVSGRVMCESAADWTKTTSIGFQYTNTLTSGVTTSWVPIKKFTLSTIRNKWVEFVVEFTVPANFKENLLPWYQIDVPSGSAGYSVVYENVNYIFTGSPTYLTNENTVLTNDYLSIKEYTENVLENGNFSSGLSKWIASANETTLEYIYTPYGPGVRVKRGNGDNGNWSLRYGGSTPAEYKADETWVWSFKFKTQKASKAMPFNVGWWLLQGTTRIHNLSVTTFPLEEDGWYQAFAPITFTETVTSDSTVASGFNSFVSNSIVDFADVQLQKRFFPTHTANGNSKFSFDYPLPSNYTISSEKREVFNTTWDKYAITKNGDSFTFYKNGEVTTEFVNTWAKYTVKGVGINKNKGYSFPYYSDAIAKSYKPDSINDHSNLSNDNAGFYFRTFIYCSAAVTTTQKYAADNYGGIRVNNGTIYSLGGYNPDTNPTITIDLVAGWNLVELVWMDGDTGGGFRLNTGTALSQLPEVLYMTAELPVDMANNIFWFNEKSNVDIRNLLIYDRALNEKEILSIHKPRGISISKSGKVKMVIKEELPYIPSDSFYFPLSVNGNDIGDSIKSYKTENVIFEDGWAWVGTSVENVVNNSTGKVVNPSYTQPGSYKPGWDTEIHSGAILCDNWSGGYNAGVTSPATGYHGHWVYEGIDGVLDPCMKFVNKNNELGYDGRWMGISQALFPMSALGLTTGNSYTVQWKQRTTNLSLGAGIGINYIDTSGARVTQTITGYNGEANAWENIYSPRQVPTNMDTSQTITLYVYGGTTSPGILWVDDMMLHTKNFYVPFTEYYRDKGALEFNLYDSLNLDWSSEWSIVYFRKPISTYTDNLTGFNLDSLGCNSNSVGGQYVWWGKDNNKNALGGSGATIDPTKYFNNPRMVSLVSKGGTITIKEWDYFGTVSSRTRATPTTANGFVTQYGYDLKLGGWDNGGSTNTYFRDLIVSKRAFSDEEIERVFKTRYSSRDDGLYVSGRVLVDSTLI